MNYNHINTTHMSLNNNTIFNFNNNNNNNSSGDSFKFERILKDILLILIIVFSL